MLVDSAKAIKNAIALSLVSALGGTMLSACAPQETSNPTAPPEAEMTNAEVTDAEVTDAEPTTALEEQIGESFYFHSTFQEQLSEALFIVREDEEEHDWGEVIVFNQSDRVFSIPSDGETPLWIYSTVEDLSEAELQEQGVPESEWANYADRPVIVAERITLVPDPSELVNNADVFLNQPVTVYGEVESVEAEDTFILKAPSLFGGKGIILVQGADAELSSVIGEEKAVVSGVLRSYVIADLEEEYELTWDLELQERLEAEYEQSPVLVVNQVLPMDN